MKKVITILLCLGMIGTLCSCRLQNTETMPEQPVITTRARATTAKTTTKMTTTTTTTEETTTSEETTETEKVTETTKASVKTAPKYVYISKGGKYHYDKKCKDIKKYTKVSLKSAKKAGYKPCSKCVK